MANASQWETALRLASAIDVASAIATSHPWLARPMNAAKRFLDQRLGVVLSALARDQHDVDDTVARARATGAVHVPTAGPPN